MHRHLKFLTPFCATLLMSLSFPLLQGSVTPGIEAVLAQSQTTESRTDEMLRLYQEGVQQYQQGRYKEALETLQQVLAIGKQVGNRAGVGSILNSIGLVYNTLGQYPKALEYYNQALAIRKEVGDKAGEGSTLNNIGGVYDNLGQYSEALEYYNQALAIRKEVGDKAGQGSILNNIGLVYKTLGQYPKALEQYKQALAIYEEVGDKASVGVTLNYIGLVYKSQGQYSEALEKYKQALAIHREVGNRVGEGSTLNNIGLVYKSQGQYSEALKHYNQALAIAKETGDRTREGATLNNIGAVYNGQGQYSEALKYYQQALVIVKEMGDRAGVGDILNNIGLVYDSLGQYSEALKQYQQALAIRKEVGDKAGEGTTLNNIGAVYNGQGQYSEALKYYQQALDIHQKLGDRTGEGATLSNLGLVYDSLGQYSEALKYYQQALDIHQKLGDRAGVGSNLNNLGSVYHSQGKYPEALEYFNRALAIRQKLGDRAGVGTTLSNMGSVYHSQSQYKKALEYYNQALVIRKEVGDRVGQGSTLNSIGAVYHSQSQYKKALEYYNQALAIRKEVGDRAGEGSTLNNIGAVYHGQRQYADAEKTLFAAIEVLESLRPGLKDADKISLFEIQSSTYLFLQDTLIAQNKINSALEVAERSRARAFVELLSSRLSSNPTNQQNIPSLTIPQIQQIAKEQNATLVQYSALDNNQLYIWVIKPTGEITFKEVDLKSLNTSLENITERARVFAATGIELTTNTPIALTNHRTRQAALATRGSPFNQQAADSQIKPITNYTSSNRALKQVYDLLIKPIANDLPTNPDARVIFIPHASLFRVPFPALIDENGKSLIENHTILTAPSIQVLDLTHKQRQQQQNLPNTALVIGNPTMPFSSENPSQRLRDLPNSLAEAKEIATLLNTQFLTGNQATKAAVIPQMKTARIIHLATHGLLNDRAALQSSIALAPSANDSGLLTADEIFNLTLNAELVVLSACDTGRGEITGDGVIGLSRAFISAGASSVIVSLWPVEDNSTQILMTNFYRHWQQNHDKAKALRLAMLEVKQQKPEPEYWAAFTLIGEAE